MTEGCSPLSSSRRLLAPAAEPGAILGVGNPARLQAVAEAELSGHLNDRDLNAIVATLRLACDVPIAVINVVSANRQTYPAEVGIGAPCTLVPDGLSFCAEVVDTGRALAVSDAATHPVYSRNPMVRDGVIGSYAGVPLVDVGVVLGSVSIFDSTPRVFSHGDLEILRHQATLASSVLALRRSARTDALTGLPNRALYLDRLGRALARLERHPGQIAVLYLDVDGFKCFNDSWGHEVGDRVLVELARRLRGALRPSDTLARFGGDEFVVLCEDLAGPDAAALVLARLVGAASEPWTVGGRQLVVDVSIGVTVTDSPRANAAALLHDADAAMYEAKDSAGSCWVAARGSLQPQTVAS